MNSVLKNTIVTVVGVLVVAAATCGALVWQQGSISEKKDEIETPTEATPEPKVVSAETRWMFAGTTFWGRRTRQSAEASDLGTKYPFSQLDSLERERYDAWIAGLECPVTNNPVNKYQEETLLQFNCSPDYLPEAKKYFTAFLLGNNHTDNQGEAGFAETKQHLDENGIQYFGSYDYKDAKTNCDILVLPVRVQLDDESEEEYQIPFGFCSAHGVFGIPTEQALQNIKHYAEILPTIAMPHMGAEYQTSADAIRQNLYHKMVDYGVEAVIADHPHWVQNAEAYSGRLITYSLGNFMFDQTFNAEVVRSAAIEAEIKIANATDVDWEAWNNLGRGCLEDRASCLENIQTAGLPRLQLEWRYDFHGTTSAGDRITRLAPEAEQAAIGQRLNWAAIPDSLKIQQ